MNKKLSGNLIIIGGAEDKEGRKEILKKVCECIKKEDDDLVIATVATEYPEEAAEKYPYQPHLALHESVYEQESQLQFRYRAEHVLSKILSENKEGTIVVITHGGMIYQLYRAFLGLPINTEVFVSTGDTGIHEWVIADGKKIIRASNKTDHLTNKNL